MYKIEKVAENQFYVKIMGQCPPYEAEKCSERFLEKIKDSQKIYVIIDLLDLVLVKISSLKIFIELLNNTSKKLERSAFVISFNPPLNEEVKYILEKAKSPKRKIVNSLEEAKEWTQIPEINIKKE